MQSTICPLAPLNIQSALMRGLLVGIIIDLSVLSGFSLVYVNY
jgi:hypothetical protein